MKKTFYTLLLIAAAAGARAQKVTTLPNGVECQVFTKGAPEKVKQNDVITFNITQRTDKDSVLFNSYTAGSPAKTQVRPSVNPSDLMSVFPLLGVKDSAVVKVPVDSIFKGHEAEMPPFLKKGGYVLYTVKIEQVQSFEDAMAERTAAIAKYKTGELAAGEEYIKAHHLAVTTTPSGLKYVVTKQGTGIKPMKGDSVYVNYVGRTARGKVFDTSIQSEAKAAGIENPARPYEPLKFVVGAQRVIAGWDEGFLLLNQGSKATLVIPGDLAYGEHPMGEDIKPYNTLIFDVELVKVVRGKNTLPLPMKAPKALAKKRTVTKKKN